MSERIALVKKVSLFQLIVSKLYYGKRYHRSGRTWRAAIGRPTDSAHIYSSLERC